MPRLSILIPTMHSRESLFNSLCAFLRNQPMASSVEILSDVDEGVLSVGEKRNRLLLRATGDYVVYVDDDDFVADTYIPDIVTVLNQGEVDCVGFFGLVYFKNALAGRMIHSVLCPSWTEETGFYYRPPNHLNPIRRDIALKFSFKPIRYSEDHFWSMDIAASGLLKREVFLGHKPMYIYRCGVDKKTL